MKAIDLPSRGLTLSYATAGRGRALVLLHAFPLDCGMWVPQLEGLADVGRVVALDLPGFGRSTAGTDAFTVEGVADIVADFLTAIGATERVVLAGLSMGGYAAMAFARRHPDRLAGLVLADTKAEPDDEVARANRDKTIALANEKGAAAVIEAMIAKVLCEEIRSKRPELVERVRQLGSRQSKAAVTAALAALRNRPDATPGLKDVTVPTLVLVGEHDAVTPPLTAAKIAGEVRGSTLVTVPGAGHLSNLENPEAFNAAVRAFLS